MAKSGPHIGVTKVCTACGVEKRRDEFALHSKGAPYVHSMCRPCQSEYSRKRYRENKDGFTDRRLRRSFGITLADYNAMLSEQDRACAICGGTSWNERLPCVDHDHKSGKVRGLLCNACNLAIGYFNDNPDTLSRAVEYLSRFHKKFQH